MVEAGWRVVDQILSIYRVPRRVTPYWQHIELGQVQYEVFSYELLMEPRGRLFYECMACRRCGCPSFEDQGAMPQEIQDWLHWHAQLCEEGKR